MTRYLIFAFTEPPPEYGFCRAKSGKCWWLKVETREDAAEIATALTNLDIHGVAKKIEGSAHPYQPRTNGSWGSNQRSQNVVKFPGGGKYMGKNKLL